MNFNIGIDIGTRNVRMAVEGYGVAFTASAAVAVRKGVDMPIAMGDEALVMRGRLSEGCTVAYPIHSGICENEALLGRWFLALFERARSIAHLRKIHVLAGCAGWIARAHRYALMQAALDAGADSVALIRSDALAAIGAGLEVARPEASFVIEAGASGIGAALLSFGRTVVSRQLPIGFAGVDGEIVGAMRAKGVRIGEDAAEEAKLALASASGASSGKLSVSTAGFDERTRLPRLVDIEANLVNALVAPYVRTLTSLCVDALAQAPIELAADLAARGARLVGGGAELFGLREHLASALGIDVFVPDNPRDAVARGLSAVLEADGTYDRLILESDRASMQ